MTPDSRELFESIIMDHNEHPRNFGVLENPTHQAEGYNPICGDRYQIHVSVFAETIDEIRFPGARLRALESFSIHPDDGSIGLESERCESAFSSFS